MRALVGPWTHGSRTVELSYAGDVEFGRDAALPSFDELHLRWFDRWLRGVDNGLDAEAPLRIFVMGGGSGRRSGAGRLVHGGRWRDEREWPLARTAFADYYLHGDGSLARRGAARGVLGTTYRFDPANPVPSIGGNVSSLRDVLPLPAGHRRSDVRGHAASGRRTSCAPGGFDQREGPGFYGCRPPYLTLGSRPDVLVFQTEPLEQPMEVTGPIEVTLWVATAAPDTDFTAKLIDWYPPSPWYPLGYALNLTDSIVRLRYRNGRERGELGDAGRGDAGHDHALPDQQPVHARPPHPARRVELEPPALRRQSRTPASPSAASGAGLSRTTPCFTSGPRVQGRPAVDPGRRRRAALSERHGPTAAVPEVDRIAITTVVDNSIDNLRADEKVARRFTHARARKMPTLRAEHGLAHWVEAAAGPRPRRSRFDWGLTGDSYCHNLLELGLDPARVDALALSHGHQDHFGGLAGFLAHLPAPMKRGAGLSRRRRPLPARATTSGGRSRLHRPAPTATSWSARIWTCGW